MSKRFSSIKLDNYKPLRDIVFSALREGILKGELKPGERLMEVQLAEEMGVSRTPVREAIRKLELEGLVVMVPRKGAYVAGLTLKDVADVFEIRGSLEGLAASLASKRITEEEIQNLEDILRELKEAISDGDMETIVEKDAKFHQVLFSATRNERLAQMVNTLKEHIDRFRIQSFTNPARMKSVLDEHQRIVDAIKDRDADSAERLAKDHINKVEYNVMNILKSQMDFKEEPL